MPVRIGILTAAHVHTGSYVHCLKRNPNAELIGLWDDDLERGQSYAEKNGLAFFQNLDIPDAVRWQQSNHSSRSSDLSLQAEPMSGRECGRYARQMQ